jgi:hypothetical protein
MDKNSFLKELISPQRRKGRKEKILSIVPPLAGFNPASQGIEKE